VIKERKSCTTSSCRGLVGLGWLLAASSLVFKRWKLGFRFLSLVFSLFVGWVWKAVLSLVERGVNACGVLRRTLTSSIGSPQLSRIVFTQPTLD